MVHQPAWKALRAEFPTLAHWTYLDVARKTVAPRCQERALQEYTRDVYENAGADAWAAGNVAATRATLAQLLGAKPSEIAFTKNTTEGLNIAAHAFDLRPGDNIVLTNMEHPANVWVWKHWEAKGVEIRYAQHRNSRLPLSAFEEQIDERTRVVSTAYVTYGNGYRVNVPELGRLCRERGIRLGQHRDQPGSGQPPGQRAGPAHQLGVAQRSGPVQHRGGVRSGHRDRPNPLHHTLAHVRAVPAGGEPSDLGAFG